MAEYTFAVYRTVDVDLDKVRSVLGGGINGDKKQEDSFEIISEPSFANAPVSHILTHHWQHCDAQSISRRYFLVADRTAWRTGGILLLTTNFRGHVDALRMRAADAGDCVPALTTTTTWQQYLGENAGALYPGHAKVAVHLTADLRNDSVSDELVLRRLQGGFMGRKADSPFRSGVFAVARPAIGSVRDVEQAKSLHRELVEKAEEDFHPSMFVVQTATGWSNGCCALVELEGSDGKPVELELETETVGELVQWFMVGLTSMQDVVKESKDGKVGPQSLFLRYAVA